jgi:hypothetical protein
LELGAGTALPSILAKLLNYEVYATDLKFMHKFVKKNILLNIFNEKTE